MGVPKQLTPMQIKFAELLVYNEGRLTATECARQAGYEEDRARITASELRNPRKFPLLAKYIGELREEVQQKYEVTFENHISELAKLREESRNKGAWSAAINAEVARGKAAGLYIDQKIIKYGSVDSLTPAELEAKMKQILEDHRGLLVEADFESVKEPQPKSVSENIEQIEQE
jgi:phage terminase small subunit